MAGMSHTRLTFCIRYIKVLVFVLARHVVCIPCSSLKECMFEFLQLIISIMVNSTPYQQSRLKSLLSAACSFAFLFVCISCLVTKSWGTMSSPWAKQSQHCFFNYLTLSALQSLYESVFNVAQYSMKHAFLLCWLVPSCCIVGFSGKKCATENKSILKWHVFYKSTTCCYTLLTRAIARLFLWMRGSCVYAHVWEDYNWYSIAIQPHQWQHLSPTNSITAACVCV